ncbi:MAG TPA: hypothetical protein VHT34_01765 [Clostridia bacterium]|nr:hypothetical protein [Clostridia bacterium]
MPEERRQVERRKGPDLLVKWIRWTVISGWLLIIAALLVIAEAKPEEKNFFDRLFENQVRESWDSNLLFGAFILLIILYLLCIIGFIFNLRRSKRKSDRISISIILLGLGSFAGIITYVMKIR